MFETLRNAWKVEDIRKKILYTLMILVIVRLGSAIPVPFLNPNALAGMLGDGNLLGYLDILTGGAFSQATLFALSISPYITSSIVMQLLAVAIPALERLQKEGEEGRKKINQITRYVTVALAAIQATAFYVMFYRMGAVHYKEGFSAWVSGAAIITAFMAGAMLVVWLGEQIDEKGIGNGISIILFAGIVSRAPSAIQTLLSYWAMGAQEYKYYIYVPLIVLIFLVLIIFIIVMTNAERRIPIQYAKRVVGRKMYGGNSSYFPVKVNMSGVLPVIFASSFLAIPGTVRGFMAVPTVETGFYTGFYKFLAWFNYNTPQYAIIYFLLIIAFNYFYIAIQYNPIQIANDLRKNNGTVPGIRPGKPTSDFISRIISKITLVGALFLGLIAVLPIILGALMGVNIALGGTSIIILVGVALDTVRSLESQMMMRHYKGFLE